jgi:hypothetical protein
MTPFAKTVRRITEKPVSRGRRIVVSLEPGDIVGVREERTRKKYNLTAAAIWSLAVKTGAI